MAYEIPTIEPVEINAGDLIKWKIAESDDFPLSASWVLSYAFVNSGSQKTITCTDNGDGFHLATILAADSVKWIAGTYRWQSYITNGLERYRVNTGNLVVQPNFAALTGGYDARTHAEIVLDAIQATIEGRATRDQSSYTIAGRQLSRTPIADLIMLRDKYKVEVAGERRADRIAKGLGHSGRILTRFTR